MEVHPVAPFRKPPKQEASQRERDSEKHCLFHNLDGHDTNDCRKLFDMVEEHIVRGDLA